MFDLARPQTFEKVDEYFKEIRARSGNVPIILVGNKNDLKETVGEAIQRPQIIQKVNQYNLFEYIETSALKNEKVKELFDRLSITALLDLRPRLGEIASKDHFRFKVLLVGAAAVGKSSLIRTFVKKEFQTDYKITVGLDFMTQEFEIPDDELPSEVLENIENAVKALKKPKKEISKKPKKDVKVETETTEILKPEEEKIAEKPKKEKVLTNRYIYLAISSVAIVLVVVILIHYLQLL